MSIQTDGTDLNSWVTNRSQFRKHVSETLDVLEDCYKRLAAAVGKRQPDPAVTFKDTSVAGITALTQESITALRAAETEWSQLASERQAATAQFQSIRADIERAAQERGRKEAEQSAVRQYWIKSNGTKLAAIVIFLATLYVLFEF